KFTDSVRDTNSPRVLAATPVDFSGNTGATVRVTVPIAVDAPPSVAIQITSATSLSVGRTLTGNVTATDDRGLSYVSVSITGPFWGTFNWTDVAGQTSATRSFSLVVPASAAAGGAVTVQASASDNSSVRQNASATNTSVAVQRDNTPPAIANVTPAANSNVVAGRTVLRGAHLTDNIGVLAFSLNSARGYPTSIGSRWTGSVTAPTVAGAFNVVLTATDLANNVTTFTLPLNVIGDNPPTGTITITPSGPIL